MSNKAQVVFYWILCIGFFSYSACVYGSHIIGGEFSLQLKNNRGNTYELSLNLYVDAVHGDPAAEDESIVVSIYKKATNQPISTVSLPRVLTQVIPYTNPVCATGTMGVKQIRYAQLLQLSGSTFNDPAGYYVVWERCCRNAGIANVRDPAASGIAIYMEFPPLQIGNTIQYDSSPVLSMPPGEYACVNQPFSFSFTATDADKDQLVYSLVTPYRGNATNQSSTPTSSPAPYPLVEWISGFSATNAISGPEPLQINAQTGVLTVTPNRVGLFVFAVKCEEYRNGKKIGEIRRDFQVMVLDCPVNHTPGLQARQMLQSGHGLYTEGDTLVISSPDKACIELLATDADPQTQLHLSSFMLSAGLTDISLTTSTGSVNGLTDTLRSQLCLPECLNIATDQVFRLGVVVEDNGCPIGKKDTLLLTIRIDSTFNTPLSLTTSLPADSLFVYEAEPVSFTVQATDPDTDQLTLTAQGEGFTLSSKQMYFPSQSGVGSLLGKFDWIPPCNLKEGQPVRVQFIAQEFHCQTLVRTDTIRVRFIYKHKNNQLPVLSSSLPSDTGHVTWGETLSLTIKGTDPEQDSVRIQLIGVQTLSQPVDPSILGLTLPVGGQGLSPLSLLASWSPVCSLLDKQWVEVTYLISQQRCGNTTLSDTLVLHLQYHAITDTPVSLTLLSPGSLSVTALSATNQIVKDTIKATADQLLQLQLLALDEDGDAVQLKALPQMFTLSGVGMHFETISEQVSKEKGILEWKPSCLLTPNQVFHIRFVAQSSRCLVTSYDTLQIVIQYIVKPNTPPKVFVATHMPSTGANTSLIRGDTIRVKTGSLLNLNVAAAESDGDSLGLYVSPKGFSLEEEKMHFLSESGRYTLSSQFSWQPECMPSDSIFVLDFIAQDKRCGLVQADTLSVVLLLEDRPNPPPLLSTDLTADTVWVLSGETLLFQITGTDQESDLLQLQAFPRGFSLVVNHMIFNVQQPQSTITGTEIKGSFTWKPECEVKDSVFVIDFVLTETRCGKLQTDTLTRTLIYRLPANTAPVITTSLPGNNASLLPGEAIAFEVLASDADADPIEVRAIGRGFLLSSVGMICPAQLSGSKEVRFTFEWHPTCQNKEGEYWIDFMVEDKVCPSKSDTVSVLLMFTDLHVDDSKFLPPNTFTPNADNVNDMFSIPDLPADNCKNAFKQIDIYNRWGQRVFTSESRDFRWDGSQVTVGAYYYQIIYTHKRYKGWIYILN